MQNMKKNYYFTIIFLTFIFFILGCKNESVDMSKYMSERDSLISENRRNKTELEELNGIMSEIALGLDSIAMQEDILYSNKDKDGVLLSKKQILENLKYLEETLARQRKKIKQLEDSLVTGNNKKLSSIVSFLNQQLAEKDMEIQSLKNDLNNRNRDIRDLRTKLGTMQNSVKAAESKAAVLSEALKTQDEVLNECYVKIGTKKELQQAGLLKGGLLSKKKINYQNVNKSDFEKVDIRRFTSVHLASSKPKILTPLPNSNSYHFEKNGDGTITLFIDDPAAFWSVSNYLIIQL